MITNIYLGNRRSKIPHKRNFEAVTYPILDPKSLPPLGDPEVRMKMHATKFTMSVPNKTNHS